MSIILATRPRHLRLVLLSCRDTVNNIPEFVILSFTLDYHFGRLPSGGLFIMLYLD